MLFAGIGGELMQCPRKCIEHICGQIIATAAEVIRNGGLVRDFLQNALNSGLGIIVTCPDNI